MANTVVCAELTGAIDNSCVRNFAKKYFQEAVFINLNDIDKENSVLGNIGGPTCDYTIQMLLKSGKKESRLNFRKPETRSKDSPGNQKMLTITHNICISRNS